MNKTVLTSGTMNLKYRKPNSTINKSTDSFDDSKIKNRDFSIESLRKDKIPTFPLIKERKLRQFHNYSEAHILKKILNLQLLFNSLKK